MRQLTIIYLILLHAALAVVIWKSDFIDRLNRRLGRTDTGPEITTYYHQILRYHARSVEAVPDECVIFIGDSITQGLAVAAVHPLGVNYGIAGDTTRGVLERLPTYRPALERAECIVLAIGVNDARYRSADEAIHNYVRILDALPQDCRVVVSAVLPLDPDARAVLAERAGWIERFNAELRNLAGNRERVRFVDGAGKLDQDRDGKLDAAFHVGDGVHLNSAGNLQWASSLRDGIRGREPKE